MRMKTQALKARKKNRLMRTWDNLCMFAPLKNDTLTIGYRTGSSNHVLQDGIVIIEHNEGDLLLMECID